MCSLYIKDSYLLDCIHYRKSDIQLKCDHVHLSFYSTTFHYGWFKTTSKVPFCKQRTEEHCYGVYVHPCTNSFSREKIFCPFDKSHLLWSSWQGAAQQTHTVVYRTTVCSINTRIFLHFFKIYDQKKLRFTQNQPCWVWLCYTMCRAEQFCIYSYYTGTKQTNKQTTPHLSTGMNFAKVENTHPVQNSDRTHHCQNLDTLW